MSAYSIKKNVARIQTEIFSFGPVEGTFTVYEDFLSYQDGQSIKSETRRYLANATWSHAYQEVISYHFYIHRMIC